MSEKDETSEDQIDLASLIEQMRANPHIPPEALAAIERAHDIFMRHVAQAPEPKILWQAYNLGKIAGTYISAADSASKAIEMATRLSRSEAGKASGKARQKRPWHDHALELALAIRADNPSWSQDDVAAEIAERWKLEGERPKISTLKTFVARLERERALPKRISRTG